MLKLDETIADETVEVVTPILNNFVNTNYKGIDEKTLIIGKGLKFVEPINRALIINEVTRVTKDNSCFYSIKADDAVSDLPADCIISEHHYESFGFSELLPVGKHSGKVIKVKGIYGDPNTGYYDKKTNSVKAYWKSAFFIIEPRSEISEKELDSKRLVDSEVSLLERKLQRLLGCKFDYTNPSHLALLTAMS